MMRLTRMMGLLLIAGLCLGQQCAPVSDSGDGQSNPSLSNDSPANQGIPEGVYSGDRLFRVTLSISGSSDPPLSNINSRADSASFGSSGDLLSIDGFPIQIGYVVETTSATGVCQQTVTYIHKGNNFYEYGVSAETLYEDPNVGLIYTTGTGVYTYSYEGGALHYEGQVDFMSEPLPGGAIITKWEYSATLYP